MIVIWALTAFVELLGSLVISMQTEPKVFNIGAVLSSGANIALFLQQIEKGKSMLPDAELIGNTVPMSVNPIRTAQDVCDNLISRQVYAVIVSHANSKETSPASVSFTCGFYNIPVIGISNRDTTLSNKNLHQSFMRTVPPYSHQADVWIELLKELNYQSVVFIHSSDSDGRSTLGRFQNLADKAKIKIETIIEYEPSLTNIKQKLSHSKTELSCRVYILYSNKNDAVNIFRKVEELNMTTSDFVWLVSEQALSATNKPNGLIGLVLKDAKNETAHIRDSVNLIIMALRNLYLNENITKPPNDCRKSGNRWETGIKLLQYLRNQTLDNGATGRISFDENNDRLESNYGIMNVIDGQLHQVGRYGFDKTLNQMNLELNISNIVWPGNQRHTPLGYFVLTHLKVVTIVEKPFVWAKPLPKSKMCKASQIKCPHTDPSTGIETVYCCEGYCIDLLRQLSDQIKFTYELYLVPDGLYGTYELTSNGTKRWNGLIGELVHKKADMIIAPLTINPERSKVIDFSKPFKYQGIGMLQKRIPKGAKLDSFLQPFQHTLWLLLMVSVHVVAVALYLLDRISPFGKFKVEMVRKNNDSEKALNLSSAIWFAWGVLLNSGVGEKTPRSFSARVLGMVWAGFAMIVVASYTANLAAFLVLDSTETEISGLEDSRLRNPVEGFTYATVRGSAVDMYFRGQVELSNMYRLMEEVNFHSAEEAMAAVKNGELNVFFWDSPRLEYEASHDCKLIISGDPFGRSGYGIAFQKNSFWTENVTLQLLGMHESGFMEGLDNRWILKGSKECENKHESFPTTLGLKNMAGVFMLVAAGIVAGIGLIIIEIIYKKRKARKMRQVTSAKRAARKWRLIVQKRKEMNSSATTTLPTLSFTRSSQNTFQRPAPILVKRDCFESKMINPKCPSSGCYSVDSSLKQVTQNYAHFQSSQPIMFNYYQPYNRVKLMPQAPAFSSLNINFPRQLETDLDIPPPPPPPSASYRGKQSQPVKYFSTKKKK